MAKSNLIPLDDTALDPAERVANDLTGPKLQSLKQELNHARLLLQITHELHAMLVTSPLEAFTNALRFLCEAEKVDHAYICSFDLDSFAVDTMYEWRREVADPSISSRGLPLIDFPWLLEQLRNRKTVVIDETSQLPPEAKKDAGNWRMLGIRSLICAPLMEKNRIVGVFGLARNAQPAQSGSFAWQPETLALVTEVIEPFRLALMRKAVIHAARSNQERLRALLRESPVAMAMFDRSMRLLFASDSWLRSFARDIAEPIGMSFEQFFPNPPKHWLESNRAVLAGASRRMPEDPYIAADLSRRWIQWEAKPWRNSNGEIGGIVVTQDDITARKLEMEEREELSQMLQQSADELQSRMQHAQKLESLGVLAGGIAHDFNNLLMGILGNAGLALVQLSPNTSIHKRVERIKTAAERAADLTNQLLAYSGKGRFVVEPVALNLVVQEMLSLLETAISKKSHVTCHFSVNLPNIEADATQIRQVVMNLVTNASEALEDHEGEIFLTTGSMWADENFLAGTYLNDNLAAGHYVFLEVSDSGKGMTRETLSRIFDPFFTTKFAGRGLGLAGVLGIVRSHRGALKVSSELGRGTTFKILFPAMEGGVPAAPETSPAGEISRSLQPRGKFLVVDDEELTLLVAEETLNTAGFEVITARDGVQAVEVFTEHSNELVGVLLDLTMPRMDGEEALRKMKAINPSVPVILSSGYSEQEVLQRVHQPHGGAGATANANRVAGFLQKPYLPSTLTRKLAEIIR